MITSIVFLPLAGAVTTGLLANRLSAAEAQRITIFCMLAATVFSSITFVDVVINGNVQTVELFRWFDSGSFVALWSLRLDVLTSVMLIVVTFVSTLVHIYSVSYMHHDPHVPRFMAYLSLFTFFMLMLVSSDNFIQLFLGWEGVGLCSYLLIGFWYKKQSACNAAIKAFIVNRVGDFGFAIGIFMIFLTFESVDFTQVFNAAPAYANVRISFLGQEVGVLNVICILLFIGCMGKSAQLGLHTWLPDAMEGPTPVSALIHAATMVTAGVFLVARCSPLFEYASTALTLVTFIGAMTAIFAATVAITQNDIKRIIAYSTCSQLGYMFFACGVSAYPAAIFHLATHAFFKALLFLGAGSVIHALSDEQDIRKMGGIYKKIPKTYALMWIGSLALAGIFPFAGFYSKDIILESAYAAGDLGNFAYFVGTAAAFLTAFYSFRLIFVVFHGNSKFSEDIEKNIHESPKIMIYPLYVLAFGAIFSGLLGYYVLDMVDSSTSFWRNSIFILGSNNPLEDAHHVPFIIKFLPSLLAIIGILLAFLIYIKMPKLATILSQSMNNIYKFLLNKWYFDELYAYIFVRPIIASGKFLWRIFDIKIIDDFGPNGVAARVKDTASMVSKLQTGYLYTYAFAMMAGLLIFISWYILRFYF